MILIWKKFVGLVKNSRNQKKMKNSENIYLNVFDYIDNKLPYKQRKK